jgi:ornithine cyclodeaminase
VRFYDRQAVADALPYAALIEALDTAFRGDTIAPDRTHHRIGVPGASDATLLLMPAWKPGRVLGVKIATIFPDNSARHLPAVNASYLLLDALSGKPEAILDGAELTARRTAAASALASRYLSRESATSLLMVGTGRLAPQLIAAHATVRKIERVLVWGRRAEAADALCECFSDAAFEISTTRSLHEAVRQSDIISCATLATDPLIRGDWLVPGQHLDLVGSFRPDRSEADGTAVSRARVYVDTRPGTFAEAGEIVQALACGIIAEDGIVGDLFDLARGLCAGRQSDAEITLFKSVGTAVEDLAAAELAVAGDH